MLILSQNGGKSGGNGIKRDCKLCRNQIEIRVETVLVLRNVPSIRYRLRRNYRTPPLPAIRLVLLSTFVSRLFQMLLVVLPDFPPLFLLSHELLLSLQVQHHRVCFLEGSRSTVTRPEIPPFIPVFRFSLHHLRPTLHIVRSISTQITRDIRGLSFRR